jgi:hypothetical protein
LSALALIVSAQNGHSLVLPVVVALVWLLIGGGPGDGADTGLIQG